MSSLGYLTIVVYLILMASVGLVFRSFNRNISDYFRSGCKGTWWLVGMSAFMSSFSVWTFTGAAGVAFDAGWSVIVIFLGNAFGFFLNFLWFAPWFRQLRATTSPEIIRERFNAPTQQGFAFYTVFLTMLHSGLHLFSMAIFCSTVFGLPMTPLIVGLGLVVVAYAVTGGSWAVMATEFLQGLILLPITIAAALVALHAVGGWHGLADHIRTEHLAHTFRAIKNPGEAAAGAFTWGWASALFLKNAVIWNTMGSAPRYFAVKDGREARIAALLCAVLMLLGSFIWFLPPMVGRLLYAKEILAVHLNKASESAYAITCMHLLPSGLLGLLVVAMFTATMSSIDVNRPAAILVKDVYPALCRLFRRKAKDELKLLGASRWVSLVLGGLVIWLALYFSHLDGQGVFDIMLNIGAYLATPVAIPMFLGLLIRKTPSWAALVAALCGFASSTTLTVGHALGVKWNFQQAFFLNAGVTAGVFLLSALAWRTTSPAYREQLRGFFARMHTPIDFAREVGQGNDLAQLIIIGGFTALIGGLVLALAVAEAAPSGKLLTAAVGGSLLLIGGVMVWIGKRNRGGSSAN